jgi:hypothetical protein
LYAIVPQTTALRGGRFEVVVNVPWLDKALLTFRVFAISPVPFCCVGSAR